MDEFGTSSFTDDGGNQTLVFFLPFHDWLDTLYKMQIQVDIEFQYLDVVGLCLYQCIETGNS
jgi:hypothetical protein